MLESCSLKLFYVLCLIYYVAAEKESPFSAVVHKTLLATAQGCMNHVHANQTDLEHLREEPPYPEKSACILKCLLEKIGIIKNNMYSKSGFIKAVTPLVFTNKKKMEHMKNLSEHCDKEINHTEEAPCQLANEVVICVFKYAPELHFKE